jgi:hypothetical protein
MADLALLDVQEMLGKLSDELLDVQKMLGKLSDDTWPHSPLQAGLRQQTDGSRH